MSCQSAAGLGGSAADDRVGAAKIKPATPDKRSLRIVVLLRGGAVSALCSKDLAACRFIPASIPHLTDEPSDNSLAKAPCNGRGFPEITEFTADSRRINGNSIRALQTGAMSWTSPRALRWRSFKLPGNHPAHTLRSPSSTPSRHTSREERNEGRDGRPFRQPHTRARTLVTSAERWPDNVDKQSRSPHRRRKKARQTQVIAALPNDLATVAAIRPFAAGRAPTPALLRRHRPQRLVK